MQFHDGDMSDLVIMTNSKDSKDDFVNLHYYYDDLQCCRLVAFLLQAEDP